MNNISKRKLSRLRPKAQPGKARNALQLSMNFNESEFIGPEFVLVPKG